MKYGSLVLAVAMLTFAFQVAMAEDNLVTNAGFEKTADNGLPELWNGATDVYQRAPGVARSGQASLRFVNTNPQQYVICHQAVKLESGRMYDFGAWVKTDGIDGPDSGATICLEWSDAQGKYLGGSYPPGVKGTKDWTWVHTRSGRVPAEAASCTASCYVRQGMTGQAWWDDVSVTRAFEDPLESVLVRPNYRGEITDKGPRRVFVQARLNLIDYDLKLDQVKLCWNLLHENHAIQRGENHKLKSETVGVSLPVPRLQPGDYEVEIALVRKDTGAVLSSKRHAIKRLKSGEPRTVFIDPHNRLIVDGKPFFPLGMYWGSVDAEQLNVYADSPFNCLMPYGSPNREQLDLCQQKGLKVFYSVKDVYFGADCCPGDIHSEAEEIAFVKQRVAEFRAHPAVLAWYINDELGPEFMPKLEARQHLMKSLDPNHPTWVVLYQVDLINHYLATFDAIGTDPYPIPDRPAAMAGEWTRKTVAGVAAARPVWQVPQVFNWACYRKTDEEKQKCRPPTLDEMRSMAWQCITAGAYGLVFYSWFDLRRDPATPFEQHWPLVKQVAQEVAELIPVLLSVDKVPHIETDTPGNASWLVKQLGKTTHLFVVNPRNDPAAIEFKLPNRPLSVKAAGNSGAKVPVHDRLLRIGLRPLEVRIVEIAGLQ